MISRRFLAPVSLALVAGTSASAAAQPPAWPPRATPSATAPTAPTASPSSAGPTAPSSGPSASPSSGGPSAAPPASAPSSATPPASAPSSAAPAAASSPAGAQPDLAPPPERAAGLTTATFDERTDPLDLPWHVLALPEYVVELAFAPLGFLVGVVEAYRIDRRVYDFLRNDAGTIKVVPNIKFSGGDGLGIGATLKLDGLLGREEELELGGVIQVNRDFKLEAGYEQSVASLDGRTIEASIEYDLNQDLDYYGFGNDTDKADHRVVERRGLDAVGSIEVFSRGSADSYGLVELGFRRATTGPGSDATTAPLEEDGDTVEVPAGFGQTLDHALAGIVLRHDSRDTEARTQRGVLAEVRTRLATGLDKANYSSLSIGGQVTGYVPVLPLYRVLVGSLSVEGVLPPYGNGEIPLDDYVLLGRKHGLRGFPNYRFRDQLGWSGSLEYRWPIYRYQDSPFMMSPGLFADVGRVGSSIGDLFQPTFHWDVGIGIAGELETSLLFRVDVGYSTEGIGTTFSLGKDL